MSRSAFAAGVHYLRNVVAAQHYREDSDEQLLHAFVAHHDEHAFAVLVRRHGPMVLQVCRRVLGQEQDAEDAFQATFLVLARKAADVRKKSSLASFLHGTAYRLALSAKRAAGRRRKHERQALAKPVLGPVEELSWREMRVLLDEEIARLPESYRTVFILCYLEELSRADAGRRLGLPERTVLSRLAAVRKRLRQRLARRGVELTAMLAMIAVETQTASALPLVPLPQLTGAAVSPAVTALAQSASPILQLGKAKLAIALLLAVVLGGSLVSSYQPASPPPAAPANHKPKIAPTQRAATKTLQIHGRVLAADGQAKAGAKLLLLDENKITELGLSAADGRFTVTIPRQAKQRYLIARSDDAGIDFHSIGMLKPGKPVELRLVKDNPIRGRIVNTEGKPIRGVRVSVQEIGVHINHSLDTFLAAFLKILAGGRGEAHLKMLWDWEGRLLAAVTDADGRFVLRGVGAERTVRLRLSGGGIADNTVRIANRAGFDPTPYNKAFRDHFVRANRRKDQPWMKEAFLHGPDLSLIAESEKLIRGVVRDADTGKAQPNLTIHLLGDSDNVMPHFLLKGKTDAEGRYEIHGARKAKRYLIQSMSDASAGYVPSQIWADDTAGYQPVPADLKVKKGVIVTGRVIDRASGKAIRGLAEAAVLAGNPFVKDYQYGKLFTPVPAPFTASGATADSDGVFRLVTIPGPVLLMGGPDYYRIEEVFEVVKYADAKPDPKYPKYFRRGGRFANAKDFNYTGLNGFGGTVDGNFCKVLDIKPGVAVVKQDIILDRASVITVKVQDAAGRPLSGFWAMGISSRGRFGMAIRIEEDSCSVYGVEIGEPRLLVFCEPSRKLAGSLTLKGDEKQPVPIKLQAMGAITGRLLDAEGKPLAGVIVDPHYRESQAEAIHFRIHEGKQVVTDAAGMFRIEELLPDLMFALSFRRGEQILEREKRAGEENYIYRVKPGESPELGEIRVLPPRKSDRGPR